MGITGGSHMFWKSPQISVDLALKVIRKLRQDDEEEQQGDCRSSDNQQRRTNKKNNMTISIDGNLVAYKYLEMSSSPAISPASAVCHLAKGFSEKQVDVLLVADHPTKRHPSKRASHQRAANISKAKLKAKILRTQLRSNHQGESRPGGAATAGNTRENAQACATKLIKDIVSASDTRKRDHKAAIFVRREWTERLGYGRATADNRQLRICPEHPMEMVHGKSTVYETSKGGESRMVSFVIPPFLAPISSGSLYSPPKTQSKGSGVERELLHHVTVLSQHEATLSKSARCAIVRETASIESPRQSASINVGPYHHGEDDVVMSRVCEKSKVTVTSLSPGVVKLKTGFKNIVQLLQYSALVYGGDLEAMAKTQTKLDWLEELVLMYEFSYGRGKVRLRDYALEYGIDKDTVKKAIVYRLGKELETWQKWPMYCSFAEDAKFRLEKWNETFPRHRVIMHDTTDIPLLQPSAGDLQRALYNKYYKKCCAKAGVAAQLCNWIFGLPLVTGHSDDDQQIQQSKILELQKRFAEDDPVDGEIIHFVNIFDKGYHQTLEAKRHGQLCVTPDKSSSISEDGNAALRAAAIAVVRSGNERAVKRVKISKFIERGMTHGQQWDIDFLCDVWEAWTFRCNFLYKDFQ